MASSRGNGDFALARAVSVEADVDPDDNVTQWFWTYEYRAKGERVSATLTESMFRRLRLRHGDAFPVVFDPRKPRRHST